MVAPEIAAAVLKPAIDFLFGEFKRFLADIRERRQKRGELNDTGALLSGEEESTKEGILVLTPANWNEEMEKEVKHLLNLIRIHSEHRRNAETKISQRGGYYYVTPDVRAELESAEDAILDYTQRLKRLLERVYGQPIHIEGLE